MTNDVGLTFSVGDPYATVLQLVLSKKIKIGDVEYHIECHDDLGFF